MFIRSLLVALRIHWFSIAVLLPVAWFVAVRIYYWIKPSLPLTLRLGVRRWLVRRKRPRREGDWPILESAAKKPPDWPGWPDQRAFAFVLTHDVETQRGLERVRQLAELEISIGFRSSFNFVPEGNYRVDSKLRSWLTESGFEVGVHDHRHDGKLYNSRAAFRAGAARINLYLKEWGAVGFRSGFMFHNLEWIKELDIQYDSSTFDTDPFEPQSDGVGSIFPFWVGADSNEGYVELPYTLAQDSTLFVMLQENSNAIWERKLAWIKSHGGMALLNVHPDYAAFGGDQRAADEYDVQRYAEFLTWVKDNHAGQYWHSLPRSVAAFCRERVAHGARSERWIPAAPTVPATVR